MVTGILQARILEWVAMPSSRGSSQTRNRTLTSCIFYTGRWILYLLPSVGSFTFSLWALQGIFFLASHLNLYSLTMKNQPQKLYFSLEIDLFPKSHIWQKVKCLPKWLIQLLLWQSLWFTLAASLSQRLGFSLSLWSACPSSHPWLRVTQETNMNKTSQIVFVCCGQRISLPSYTAFMCHKKMYHIKSSSWDAPETNHNHTSDVLSNIETLLQIYPCHKIIE